MFSSLSESSYFCRNSFLLEMSSKDIWSFLCSSEVYLALLSAFPTFLPSSRSFSSISNTFYCIFLFNSLFSAEIFAMLSWFFLIYSLRASCLPPVFVQSSTYIFIFRFWSSRYLTCSSRILVFPSIRLFWKSFKILFIFSPSSEFWNNLH